MRTHAVMEQKLLDTVRSVVETARQENSRELAELRKRNLTTTNWHAHKLEHSLERESHSLLTMLSHLSAYQRAVETSLGLRSLAFQEQALFGKSASDQATDHRVIGTCFKCGVEVKRNG